MIFVIGHGILEICSWQVYHIQFFKTPVLFLSKIENCINNNNLNTHENLATSACINGGYIHFPVFFQFCSMTYASLTVLQKTWQLELSRWNRLKSVFCTLTSTWHCRCILLQSFVFDGRHEVIEVSLTICMLAKIIEVLEHVWISYICTIFATHLS